MTAISPNNKNLIRKEVIKFLAERRDMLEKGYPYCDDIEGIQMHCDTCIENYQKRLKIHKD